MGLWLLLWVGRGLVEVLALFPVSFMVTKGVLFFNDMTHSPGTNRVWDNTIIIDGVSLLNYEPVWDEQRRQALGDGGCGC
jgi:hypothetical protein